LVEGAAVGQDPVEMGVEQMAGAAFDRLKEIIGKHPRCPMCGGSEWRTIRFPVVMWAVPEGPIKAGASDLPIVPAVCIICARCAFVSTHATDELLHKALPIEEPAPENDQPGP
jgi:hypothetical protein